MNINASKFGSALKLGSESISEELPAVLANELLDACQSVWADDGKAEQVWLSFLIWLLTDAACGVIIYLSASQHQAMVTRAGSLLESCLSSKTDRQSIDDALELAREIEEMRKESGYVTTPERLMIWYGLEAAESAILSLVYPEKSRWLVFNAACLPSILTSDAATKTTVMVSYAKKLIALTTATTGA